MSTATAEVATPFEQKQNSLIERDSSAIAAAERAKSMVQARYVMALQRPRNIEQARVNILHFCEKPGFAEKAEYCKPVGGTTIKGPSIRFAETALREFRNVDVDHQLIYEDDERMRFQVTVTDLESNVSHGCQFTINKTVERKSGKGREIVGERTNTNGEKVFIVKATEDEIQNRINAMKSKVIRNEGLRLIPSDIIEESMEAAKKTRLSADKKDPDAAKRKIIDSFASIGVGAGQLQSYLGHALESIQPAEIEDLRSIYSAIKEGEAKWRDYYDDEASDEPEKPNGKKAKGAEKMDAFAGKPKEKPNGEKTLLDE